MTEPGFGSLNEQSAVRTLEFGDVRATYVIDGAMALSGAVFFPEIPADYWAAHPDAADAEGRVAMPAGALLVERNGRFLLIDAGLGEMIANFTVGSAVLGPANSGALPDTLAALGREPADVEALAFTHLHVDHTGWAFVRDGNGGYRPFFPNARYLVAASEWAPHERGETMPGGSSRTAVIEPLAKHHVPITDGEEIFPGVHALVTPGHSPGHTSYLISSTAGTLVAFGDAFHLPAQLAHPEWPSAPDIDGAAVLVARRRVLDELAKPDTLGFGTHFGDQPFGRLGPDGAWQPVPSTAVLPPPRKV
ncbi:MAG TPA: MBL fold metallo-hydrolase [Pseudonocardiaceae bacterium]|jgi:glyoxylase-like metal-dependent hydrolase (beta-lactamase superfamily II)|nr:MBL fold metallo-hydrolase [Pseudonocardiaceae bacterium]